MCSDIFFLDKKNKVPLSAIFQTGCLFSVVFVVGLSLDVRQLKTFQSLTDPIQLAWLEYHPVSMVVHTESQTMKAETEGCML